MQKTSRNISTAQLVTLLFLSRIFTLFTFVPRSGASVSGSTVLLVIPLAALGMLPLLLPWLLLSRGAGPDPLTAAQRAAAPYGAAVSACFGLFCLIMAAWSAAHFTYFLISTSYPRAGSGVILLWFMPVAAYAAKLGLEAFSRVGTFLLFLVLLASLLTLGALIPQVDLTRVASPLLEGPEAVWGAVLRAVAGNGEIVLFLLLAPRSEGKRGRAYLLWILLSALFFELASFLVLTALGDYAGTRLFPLHTASAAAQIPLIGRLDLLDIAIWIFMAFVRVTAYLYGAYTCLRRIFPKLSIGAGAALCGAAAGIAAILWAADLQAWAVVSRAMETGLPLLLLAVGFPLLTLCFPRAKKPRRKEARE